MENTDKRINIIKHPKLKTDMKHDSKDIPDPYHIEDIEEFDSIFMMIQTCVDNFLSSRHIKR